MLLFAGVIVCWETFRLHGICALLGKGPDEAGWCRMSEATMRTLFLTFLLRVETPWSISDSSIHHLVPLPNHQHFTTWIVASTNPT
ncbi:hypothetical protein EV126DRAFT_423394 [Verticillium dahliae]|nr:hypothetical protein EV126DRAFT_423394 [Verticillium dahliae]